MRRALTFAATLTMLVLSGGRVAWAQDPCAPYGGGFNSGIDDIQLRGFGEGRQADFGALDSAGAMWNGCGGVPNFGSFSGDQVVDVIFYAGRNDGRAFNCGSECGCYNHTTDTVHVFEFNNSLSRDCRSQWGAVIAHELGHHLGLGNADAGCGCRIMGNTACGPVVIPEDCSAVDPFWSVPSEDPSPEPPPHGCRPAA